MHINSITSKPELQVCDLTNEQSACARLHAKHQHPVIEDSRQLGVCQRKRPQPQVTGGVGHCSQHKLDGVDHLVHQDLAKVKLLVLIMLVSC